VGMEQNGSACMSDLVQKRYGVRHDVIQKDGTRRIHECRYLGRRTSI
jgi:hypothetical protein